jgi:hypothetical protein
MLVSEKPTLLTCANFSIYGRKYFYRIGPIERTTLSITVKKQASLS